jgi:hypothetical protein
MKIDKQTALEMATKYKLERPQTFHSINYIAKQIYKYGTYEWFKASTQLKENK